jgi:hypothetical protein
MRISPLDMSQTCETVKASDSMTVVHRSETFNQKETMALTSRNSRKSSCDKRIDRIRVLPSLRRPPLPQGPDISP